MVFCLDHLAVTGSTRDAARAHVEESLGVAMRTGGAHPDFATHNHLMGLEDGLYLEAIAIDPEAPPPNRPRWFDIDSFTGPPRLTNWICACDDIAALSANWPDIGVPISLSRGDLRWQMAVPLSGKLPWDNLHPAVIEWEGALHPAEMLESVSVSLRELVVRHPDASSLRARLGLLPYVRFETGAAELAAIFDTPHGERTLL